VEYYVVNPYLALVNQLKTLRDSFPLERMGIALG
jgi:hypothetical protein